MNITAEDIKKEIDRVFSSLKDAKSVSIVYPNGDTKTIELKDGEVG